MRDPITQPTPLVCDQCHRAHGAGNGRGWRADLAGGHDDLQLEVVILCPEGWRREFGE